VTLNLDELKKLLWADLKRKRQDYDSYKLVRQRKNVPSIAWQYEELLKMSDNLLDFPKSMA